MNVCRYFINYLITTDDREKLDGIYCVVEPVQPKIDMPIYKEIEIGMEG